MDGHDIRYDGRGAALATVPANDHSQRQKARRFLGSEAATKDEDPHAALRELLDMTDLTPTEGEAR